MKVLHCVPSLEGGGAERQLTYLVKELVQIGWDVHVAYVQGGPNLRRLEGTGATLHQLKAIGNYDPRIFWQLLRILRTVEPDIVQCWLLQMEVLGGLASMLTRTPWVFSERSCEHAYPPSLKSWLRVKVGLLATAIVPNSDGGDRYWRGQARRPLRSRVIPNGLPLVDIANAPTATFEEAGVTTGDPLVLNAGRFGPEKNFDTFIRAMRLVVSEHAAEAICCGDGPLRRSIDKQIAETGLTGRVRTTGYAANLWSLMKRASVTVSVSLFEGSPNVVLEAMACGCPLVVSDIAAHRELLDERAAMLVNPREPRQIADAIVDVLRDPDAAAKRAQVAHDRIQRYALSTIARQYADLYRELVASKRRVARVAL